MKPVWLAAAAVVAMLAARHAQAQDGGALATSKGCTNCHTLDQKKMGPSFKEIAAKYTGNANAEPTLMAELKEGKGHPKFAGTDADLKSVIEYVLSAR